MVLQFVGYLAAWQFPGNLSRPASAALAALLATWATFLPCFFFILLGAPWVEHLLGRRRLSAALSGITAAVVGVILNLAVLLTFEVEAVWIVLAGGIAGLLAALAAGRL